VRHLALFVIAASLCAQPKPTLGSVSDELRKKLDGAVQSGIDLISIGVGISAMTDRRIGFAFDVHERGTDRLICEASYRVACVDATTFATRTFPDEVVSLLAPACQSTALQERSGG
jgi:hypothetical protein